MKINARCLKVSCFSFFVAVGGVVIGVSAPQSTRSLNSLMLVTKFFREPDSKLERPLDLRSEHGTVTIKATVNEEEKDEIRNKYETPLDLLEGFSSSSLLLPSK